MIYWILKHFVVGPPVRLVFRPWIRGKQNIPEEGAAILASNHLSFSDSIFLPLLVDRRITFPAKQEYFVGTGVKGWLSRMFFTVTGQIPIDRSGGEAALAALEAGLEVLRRGELFGIYPEGTRSPDGRLYRGKTGMARLALAADVPIVPCAMIDTDKAQPTGQKIPNIVRVGVRVGRPIHHPELAGRTEDHEALRMITDEVMRELQRLSGQEYVDEYAATVKKRLAERARVGLDRAREDLDRARESLADAAGRAREDLDRAREGLAEAAGRAREGLAARRRHQDAAGDEPAAGEVPSQDRPEGQDPPGRAEGTA
ncbi:lysophospholipid acyltransferase family protein [Ornithinimicrobium avium]|uniref:1-acyl-sn-glycerol-3-phosphate acyltransferase n=1 Tax=Ornithinimicrobium avium TaxID=2283195 RepID=A0A345NKM9_9MICO|nr:lysophospholipid acyltransferase family protein [Ornithinimicrobium avium]AXH95587.1 1-acyl-sn-glycerol-3-phosphate acyltransferase [Ornithinimicrobium avium]